MSSEKQRIVVIGASAAGLRAAARTGRLLPEAEITVLDKTDRISVSACGLPYFLSGDVGSLEELRSTPYGSLRDAEFFAGVKGLRVRTGVEVQAIDPEEKLVRCLDSAGGAQLTFPYDTLVVASGSEPIAPPGFDKESERMHFLRGIDEVRLMRSQLEQGLVGSVIVVGGGFIGCEAAEAYGSMWGAEPTLVEAAPQVLPRMLDAEMAAPVQAQLRENGVTLKLGCPVRQLSDTGETVRVDLAESTLTADVAVCALGVRPAVEFAVAAGLEIGSSGGLVVDQGMATSRPDIYAAGDCVELTHHLSGRPVYLPLGSLANRHGRLIGNRIAGRDDRVAPVPGSAVVKVFEMTAASTGLTEAAARAAGIDARSAWGSFEDRPSYYPDSKGIHLKLVYERGDRLRLLGLQAVGLGEVVREVDVMAGLLQRGGGVRDLLDLEFAYSPPYASALDPLYQLAALVLNSEEDGIGFLPPQTAEDGAEMEGRLVVDIREDEERQTVAPGFSESVHLPFTRLRRSLDQLPAGKPLLCVCAKGLRSYEAVRILRHAGWDDVVYLGGGAQLRRPQRQGG